MTQQVVASFQLPSFSQNSAHLWGSAMAAHQITYWKVVVLKKKKERRAKFWDIFNNPHKCIWHIIYFCVTLTPAPNRNNLEKRLILTHGSKMKKVMAFVHLYPSGAGHLMVVGALMEAVFLSTDKKAQSMTGTRDRHTWEWPVLHNQHLPNKFPPPQKVL